jgi:hypothetical protein
VIFLLYLGTDLFDRALPSACSLLPYYQRVFEGFRSLCRVTYRQVVGPAERTISVLMVHAWIPGIKLDLIIPESATSASEKGRPSIVADGFRVISQADQKYTNAVDQTVRTRGMFGHISRADQMYDNAFDKAKIIAHKGMFGHISRADQMYDSAFDRAGGIAERGIFSRISQADENFSMSIDRAAEKRGIFKNAMRADGHLNGAYDSVIFSRFFWGMFAKHEEFKVGLWRYFNLMEDYYDRLIERTLFGIIGSEDLSKIQLGSKDFARSWFLRMCKRASEIHTGDISVYITWITVTLTIILATLVGFLYIKSFFALIVALTTIVTFFAVLFVTIGYFLK